MKCQNTSKNSFKTPSFKVPGIEQKKCQKLNWGGGSLKGKAKHRRIQQFYCWVYIQK